jgi:hypothetical protein
VDRRIVVSSSPHGGFSHPSLRTYDVTSPPGKKHVMSESTVWRLAYGYITARHNPAIAPVRSIDDTHECVDVHCSKRTML